MLAHEPHIGRADDDRHVMQLGAPASLDDEPPPGQLGRPTGANVDDQEVGPGLNESLEAGLASGQRADLVLISLEDPADELEELG